jgi:hypothetical protein
MMPVLIQGPKQPGNDIDVYLRPLVEELQLLWSKLGVRVWDEYKQEEFDLRVLFYVKDMSTKPKRGKRRCLAAPLVPGLRTRTKGGTFSPKTLVLARSPGLEVLLDRDYSPVVQ